MKLILGIGLILGSLAMGILWWKGGFERQKRGILPLHQAGPMFNPSGQRVPLKKSLEAFIAHWQMLSAIWLALLGIGFLSSWSS